MIDYISMWMVEDGLDLWDVYVRPKGALYLETNGVDIVLPIRPSYRVRVKLKPVSRTVRVKLDRTKVVDQNMLHIEQNYSPAFVQAWKHWMGS